MRLNTVRPSVPNAPPPAVLSAPARPSPAAPSASPSVQRSLQADGFTPTAAPRSAQPSTWTPAPALADVRAGRATLKRGMEGEAVKHLQSQLVKHGHLSSAGVDGKFGAGTEAAVKAFQKAQGLTPPPGQEGTVGKTTLEFLDKAPAAAVELKQGSRGPEVTKLQNRLNQLGYPVGSADGSFGAATKRAVEDFQRTNGLAANGVASAATQAALFGPNAKKAHIGILSEKYESRGGPGTVARTPGDPGGPSYGMYQLATNTGSAQDFVNWTRSRFPSIHSTLAGKAPGSSAFDSAWKEVARRDENGFRAAQDAYYQEKFYTPGINNIRSVAGLDVSKRSQALQQVAWSTIAQHGMSRGGAATVFDRALAGRDPSRMTDDEIIRAVYAERGRTDGNGTLVYFRSSSAAVQRAVANRFRSEVKDALAIHDAQT